MHFILLLSLQFLSNLVFCPSRAGTSILPSSPTIKVDFFLVQKKITKKKIRWKQVFKPIKIFKKKLKFWLVVLGLVSLGLGSFFWLANFGGGLEGWFFKLLFGIFAVSTLLFTLSLLAIPVILIIRIIKEIKWSKRNSLILFLNIIMSKYLFKKNYAIR